ncbi:hypothetical protein EBR96_00690 [bacterium]|nr:hypothetical protein [bacterium]
MGSKGISGTWFDEIIDRILSRIGCQQCGKVYSSRVDNLAEGEACPACGATLVARSDDSRDVLKVRYDIFQRELNPILEYYEDRVINIDGRRPAEDVFLEVVKQIRIQNVESFNA